MRYTGEALKHRIQELIERIENGEKVTKRDMKAVLGDLEITEYEQAWDNTKILNKEMAETPDPLKEYAALISKADVLYRRADYLSQRGKASARALFGKANAAYETAFERLAELCGGNPYLETYLDRPLDWHMGKLDLNLTPESAPRLKTGRSIYKQSSALKRSKNDLKQEALQRKLDELDADPSDQDEINLRIKTRLARFNRQ